MYSKFQKSFAKGQKMDREILFAIGDGIMFTSFTSGLLAATVLPVYVAWTTLNELNHSLGQSFKQRMTRDFFGACLGLVCLLAAAYAWAVPHLWLIIEHGTLVSPHVTLINTMGDLHNEVSPIVRWSYWMAYSVYSILMPSVTAICIAFFAACKLYDLVKNITNFVRNHT
jgi:hypothetical protein